jgi:hypothetical protein
MREHVGEFAVVGEDEQPGGLRIETADIEQPLLELRDVALQVRAPALVLQGTHDADRLVEHEVAARGVELDGGAVNGDAVGRHDPSAEFRHDLAVDLDPACRDEVLGDAARRDARGGHELLQTDALRLFAEARSVWGGRGHHRIPSDPSAATGRWAAARRSS